MTTEQIQDFVNSKKVEGFSPTQVKMQLAFKGVNNDQINAIGSWQVVWNGGTLVEVIDN